MLAWLLFACLASSQCTSASKTGGSCLLSNESCSALKVSKKLLARPAHRIPPATFHLQDAESLSERAFKGPLNYSQLEDFYRDGFLHIPDFYPLTDVEAVRHDVDRQIDLLARDLFAMGKLKSLHEGLDWTQRLNRMRQEYPDAPVLLVKRGVLPESMQRMFSEPRILDVVAQLGVGPDVALNAAWNLRAKMQSHEETVVPWHQDNSYWEPRIWDENVLTVWVSLVDATRSNGCMQFIRGGHRSGRVANHTIGSSTTTWYTELAEAIAAQDLLGKQALDKEADIATVEAKAGSIIIFPGTTPHRSMNSISDRIRWSVDFRLHRKRANRSGSSDLDWFYGLKDSLLLREDPSVDESYRPDWSAWANVERTSLQDAKQGLDADVAKMNFDPVIVGPWMDLWDLESDARGRRNPHIERYLAGSEESRDLRRYIDKDQW